MRKKLRRAEFALLLLLLLPALVFAGAAKNNAVLRLMKAKVIPASTVVFEAAAEAPANGAGWQAALQAADALAAAAEELKPTPRGFAATPWQNDVAAFADAARATRQAVARRDAAALEASNGALYQSCETCHTDYPPRAVSARVSARP